MAGDDESALLTARHIVTELLLGRKCKKLSSETSHIGNNFRIDAMVDDLEDPTVLASVNDLPADLGPAAAFNVVDSGDGDDRDFIAELVVRNFGTLILVADEIGLQSWLIGKIGESGS